MPDNQPSAFVKKDFSALVDHLLEDLASGRGGRTAFTDHNEGSVVRTLVEVFARELAVAYEQLENVYRSGFLETATGTSLDKVVDLLGIQRRMPGHLEGIVTFSRGFPAPEDIPIPAGTWVAGRDVPTCATTRPAVLLKGAQSVDVEVLSLELADIARIKAGVLATMPQPIIGLEQVTNPADLLVRQRAETDSELRERARHLAQATQSGTTVAMLQAIRALGLQEVHILEYPQEATLTPGKVEVIIGDLIPDEAQLDQLLRDVDRRIQEVRPAGILVQRSLVNWIWVDVAAVLTLNANYPERQRQALETELSQNLKKYFAQLKIGETIRQEKIRAILTQDEKVISCEPLAPARYLLTPFTGKVSTLDNQAARFRASESGDIIIGPRERAALLLDALPIRLVMQEPAPEAFIDIVITLETEISQRTVQAALLNAYHQLLNPSSSELPIEQRSNRVLKFTDFADIAQRYAKANTEAMVQVTIVHERDGSVVELSMPRDYDALSWREIPRIRHFAVHVQG